MSLKFGLTLKNKSQNAPNRPTPAKRKPIFDEEEDEEETSSKSKPTVAVEEIGEFNFDKELENTKAKEIEPSRPKKKPSGPPSSKPKPLHNDPTINSYSTSAQYAEADPNVDPSIYDYDAAYDAINAGRLARKAAEEEDAVQRRPKYMENLLESAEQRKKDQLRARDKVVQKEREAEGDDFADKEKFVTGAYKAQQEETRRLEEEEKRRQEEEEKKRKKAGMQGFYKKVMQDEENRHKEVMETAARVAKGEIKVDAETSKVKSDAEIATELKDKGKNIILNDEGQIADKRQLLSAGLNVVARPKSTTSATPSSRPSAQPVYQGRNATQKAVRERQSKMLEEQLAQAAKRVADDEAEEQRKLEHASKSRKTEQDISSARERYLQRKREAAAAAGKGS